MIRTACLLAALTVINLPLIMAAPAAAPPAGITAHHGKIYATEKAGVDTEGFIEIYNGANTADTLTGADCAIADTTSIVGSDGKTIDKLAIAPAQSFNLAANGPHLLLSATHFSIDEGGAIPCSLNFQNAGEILVYLYPVPAP